MPTQAGTQANLLTRFGAVDVPPRRGPAGRYCPHTCVSVLGPGLHNISTHQALTQHTLWPKLCMLSAAGCPVGGASVTATDVDNSSLFIHNRDSNTCHKRSSCYTIGDYLELAICLHAAFQMLLPLLYQCPLITHHLDVHRQRCLWASRRLWADARVHCTYLCQTQTHKSKTTHKDGERKWQI